MAIYRGENLITPSPAIATTSRAGIVQPDGTSISVSNGVISAAGAKLYTLDGLSITSTNVDIRTLLQAVDAKNLPIGSIVTGAVDLTDAPADNISNSNIHIESYKFTESSTTSTIYRATLTSQGAAPYQWFIEYWNTHPQGSMTWVEAPLAFYSMPTASSKYVNMVAQFVGSDDGIHVQGKFYICQEVTPVTTPSTYEWVLVDISTVKDVQVNGTSILSNGVANIPYAGSSDAGVIKINGNYGTDRTSTGYINSPIKTYAQYSSISDLAFIGKGTLENVITGKELATLTASITDASTLTLVNNTIYTASSALTSLTIAYPATISTKFIAKVNFTTSTSMTMTIPSTIKMRGDSCENDVFTPEASSTYSIMFSTVDGTNNYGLVIKM